MRPLHMTIRYNIGRPEAKADVVKILLNKGADVNLLEDPDDIESIPLIIAVKVGNSKIVNILLKHGADGNFCDQNGKSLFRYAIEEGKAEIASLLAIHGAGFIPKAEKSVEEWKKDMCFNIRLFSGPREKKVVKKLNLQIS